MGLNLKMSVSYRKVILGISINPERQKVENHCDNSMKCEWTMIGFL